MEEGRLLVVEAVQPVRLLVDKVADDVSMGAQVCRVEYEGYDSLVILRVSPSPSAWSLQSPYDVGRTPRVEILILPPHPQNCLD